MKKEAERVDSRKWAVPLVVAAVLFFLCFPATNAFASDVMIIADTRLKPIAEVIDQIKENLQCDTEAVTPDEASKDIAGLVMASGAKVVVALGVEAANISFSLPETVPIVYGLVVSPLPVRRKNVTGIYLATPAKEYSALLDRYMPTVKKVGVVCEREMIDLITPGRGCESYIVLAAATPYDFVNGIATLGGKIDAFLLLPDKHLLSATAIEKLYHFSFSEKMPVLGVSEKHVKMGSLMALVFDDVQMGKQIGQVVKKVLTRGSASEIPVAPPEKLNLFLNTETAKRMNIALPEALLKLAKRIYP